MRKIISNKGIVAILLGGCGVLGGQPIGMDAQHKVKETRDTRADITYENDFNDHNLSYIRMAADKEGPMAVGNWTSQIALKPKYVAEYLRSCISSGNGPGVAWALKQGFNIINAFDFEENTALTLAIFGKQSRILQVLLAHPLTDLKQLDFKGVGPLQWALESGDPKIVACILRDPRTDPNQMIWIEKEPPRWYYGTLAEIQQAIADNRMQVPPLYGACKQKNYEFMRLVVGHPNVDVNAQTSGGDTALQLAWNQRDVQAIEILLQHPKVTWEEPKDIVPCIVSIANSTAGIIRAYQRRMNKKLTSRERLWLHKAYKKLKIEEAEFNTCFLARSEQKEKGDCGVCFERLKKNFCCCTAGGLDKVEQHHFFCHICIEKWMKSKENCPNCNGEKAKFIFNLESPLAYYHALWNNICSQRMGDGARKYMETKQNYMEKRK